MRKTKYAKTIAFINRKTELRFLQDWADKPPKDILFIHGPRSSGKTTLLYKFTNNYLEKNQFDVKFLNLRQISISKYQDFVKVFFELDYSDTNDERRELKEYSRGVFKLNVGVLKELTSNNLDPFKVLEGELVKLHENGIDPFIIIDELNALEDIYMYTQRELLIELFNFFVAMVEESNLCHIILSSSDGCFLDEICHDSKLSKCANFFEVDYLPKDDVVYWLNNLKKESGIENLLLTEAQIEKIWYYFGGSVWEINSFLSTLMFAAKDKKIEDAELIDEAEKLRYRYRSDFSNQAVLDTPKMELYKLLNNILQDKKSFSIGDLTTLVSDKLWNKDDLKEELMGLSRRCLIAYDPTKATYKLQGHSVALGLRKFCEEL